MLYAVRYWRWLVMLSLASLLPAALHSPKRAYLPFAWPLPHSAWRMCVLAPTPLTQAWTPAT